MNQNENSKLYDLEERTLNFAREVRLFVRNLTKSIANIEDGKQLIRSSGSIGANYIEANESLSKKDFLLRIRISRKEAKETRFWLNLVDINKNLELDKIRAKLINESIELMKIFSTIMRKSE